ncbi:MAG: hypothetical protein P4N59_07650 [Negativicutes bacterium]|nr:hypothetical protein [Negativicutes bacterium]
MNTGSFDFHPGLPEDCMSEECPEFCIQLCETDRLPIPCHDPDIQEIVRLDIKIKTHKFRTIATAAGKKLVIHALKKIEVIFKSGGVRFVSHFVIPFCTFILLDDKEEKVSEIRYVIEDSEIFLLDRRSVTLSTVIFVCPEFHKKHGPEGDHDPNTIRCDIQLKSSPPPKSIWPGNHP